MLKREINIKNIFLTLAASLLLVVANVFPVYASTFFQDVKKSHLRWNISTAKEQLHISKKNAVVRIQTLNMDLYKKIVAGLSSQVVPKSYVQKLTYTTEGYPENPATIKVQLKDDTVELFNFYMDAQKSYVLDFWVNEDLVKERKEALANLKKPKMIRFNAKKKVAKKVKKKPVLKAKKINLSKDTLKVSDIKNRIPLKGYRDFRYGASFVWNYPSLVPKLGEDINLGRKIPEFFYPIKDRTFDKDKKEAHMQLSINLYRKGLWGKMAKSIELYEKRYGKNSNSDLNKFLKANSILKKNLTDKNKGLALSALSLLEGIAAQTKNYDLKKACVRYIIQFHRDNNDYIKTLQFGKKFFVEAKKNFDNEVVEFASAVILDSLAKLKQISKIKQFVSDLKAQKVLNNQNGIAYLSYAYLELGKTDLVIKLWEDNKANLVNPVHPAILFNTAEAYFRESNFKKSIKMFDAFASEYSHLDRASHARLRIALAYEISGKDMKKVKILYKNALNRSPNPEVRYEAKLRYIALELARKIDLKQENYEAKVFFEASPDEKQAMTKDLRRLLWLVRLRTFINTGKYEEALTYLTSIPLDALKALEKKTFLGDGAEIVYGLIKDKYEAKDYAKAVKLWEVYKNKYESKVAKNPYMNFIICDSFLKLGLYKSFDRSLKILKDLDQKVTRTYPIWIYRTKESIGKMIQELNLIKLIASSNWELAQKFVATTKTKFDKLKYYEGIIQFNLKQYQNSTKAMEKVLTTANLKNKLKKNELSEVVRIYIESLNKNNDKTKFKKAAKAIISDIRKIRGDKLFSAVYERVAYLLIESMASDPKTNFAELLGLTANFLKDFKDSKYRWRISYLRGVSLINGIDLKAGKKQLRSLMENNDAPGEIQDLARSELSVLELSNNL